VSPRVDFLDVPKSPAIAALPTTGRGMPVPYITLYRPNDGHDVTYTVRATRGPMCACTCKLGEGRPVIGVQCVSRQRRAMRKKLCGVCGQDLHPGDDIIFIGPGETFAHGSDGSTVPASIEAPLHPECAAYSALTCPRLLHQPATITLAVMREYSLADQLLVGYDANRQPRYVIAPPAADHSSLGALNSYAAVLQPEHGRLTTLEAWMYDEAPALA